MPIEVSAYKYLQYRQINIKKKIITTLLLRQCQAMFSDIIYFFIISERDAPIYVFHKTRGKYILASRQIYKIKVINNRILIIKLPTKYIFNV